MTKILFQRFIDRDGNEIGHRCTPQKHSSIENYNGNLYDLQFFEVEKGLIVAVYRLKRGAEVGE